MSDDPRDKLTEKGRKFVGDLAKTLCGICGMPENQEALAYSERFFAGKMSEDSVLLRIMPPVRVDEPVELGDDPFKVMDKD